jgi:acetate kinase
MIVATVNAGSTSVRLGAYDAARAVPRELVRERHANASLDAEELLRRFAGRLDAAKLTAIAHRVVHGGTAFTEPVIIDPSVLRRLGGLSDLAPLHNPVALAWIEAARRTFDPSVKQIAVFDTAFFAGLPAHAARYAIPARLGTDLGVRRYGFHGLAHEAMWQRWCALRPELDHGGRLITFQLGGGCSVAAIERGRPLDTSMGFTPLEGLVMQTRCGDIDPSVVPYLAQRLGESCERVIERLNRESGLAGVSGRGGDMSALVGDDSPDARLAVDLFCVRARKYLGAYLALMGGCDGVAFGGGIGEHVPAVRARIIAGMEWAGISLDADRNLRAAGEARISADASRVDVLVVAVDEEQALARAAQQALRA